MPFIQDQNETREDYKLKKKNTQVKLIVNSRQTKGTVLLLCFAILSPVLIYYFVIDKGTYPEEATDTCSVEKTYRVPCGRRQNATYDYCTRISCCFDNSTQACFHYLPSKYYYFSDSDTFGRSLQKSPFGEDQLKNVALTVQQISVNTIRISLHDDSINLSPVTDLTKANYYYNVSVNPLYIEVFRNQSDQLLLTTAKGATIISDKYWEWSFQLTEEYLFGLGQTLIDLDEDSSFTKVVYGNDKDHNTLLSFMAYTNKSWHGLVVRHNGPLEVTVLPSKLVILKSLSGREIALELSVGPSIQEVMTQQNPKVVSGVDLETLGIHICREGTNMRLKDILSEYTDETTKVLPNLDVEYETDCLHENLMLAMRKEKNYNISNTLAVIASFGDKKFTLALPPQINYQSQFYNDTRHLDVFFKNFSEDYVGVYLEEQVVYPNFQHPSISDYVQNLFQEIVTYFDQVPQRFLLVKNWPADESFEMVETSDFQYLSQDLIDAMSSTLSWNVTSNSNAHYLDHNTYGSFQLTQLGNISDSYTFMTASHTLDTHQPIMVQNVDTTWTNFQKAIVTTLYNSLFGFPLTSVPVCGSTSNFDSSHESLCLRWYYMAVTAPIFRISSDLPRRDPNSLGFTLSNYTANNAKWAIDLRNQMKYYLYTVLASGEPLMRPMFYDYPDDVETFSLVEQYMVGKDLLVAQPTVPDQSVMRVYLPKTSNWVEYWGGGWYNVSGWVSLPIVETDWVGFVREGAVIPLVNRTTDDLKVILKVALKCDEECSATGILNSGDDLFTFSATDGELTVDKSQTGVSNFVLSQIEIFKSGNATRYTVTETSLYEIDKCTYSEDAATFVC